MTPLPPGFFHRDARTVAVDLLGKVLRHRVNGRWLEARIIETEAYLLEEWGSHASLGWTPKRGALFMEPGTIYMYYARGGDSANFSCEGPGNAVLLKSGVPHPPESPPHQMLTEMQRRNPVRGRPRKPERLCSGQTLLCRSLGLRVPDWDQEVLLPGTLELYDPSASPEYVLQTTRLGIPPGRDEHLPYRFLDAKHVRACTRNPLTSRSGDPVYRWRRDELRLLNFTEATAALMRRHQVK